jgi:hypothetical protein
MKQRKSRDLMILVVLRMTRKIIKPFEKEPSPIIFFVARF